MGTFWVGVQEVKMSWLFLGLVLVSFSSSILTQKPDPLCPFGDGTCPITLDNVVDVYYHDVVDFRSCQRECAQIEDCHFWTMFNVTDDPKDHKKCFLFKTCDHLEPCMDCITGPDAPLYDPDLCDNNGNRTCETSKDNIVDVYYFDVDDTFSCPDQCKMLPDCHFWTHFDVTDDPHPHHKCFLYKECTITEPCSTCETGGPI